MSINYDLYVEITKGTKGQYAYFGTIFRVVTVSIYTTIHRGHLNILLDLFEANDQTYYFENEYCERLNRDEIDSLLDSNDMTLIFFDDPACMYEDIPDSAILFNESFDSNKDKLSDEG